MPAKKAPELYLVTKNFSYLNKDKESVIVRRTGQPMELCKEALAQAKKVKAIK